MVKTSLLKFILYLKIRREKVALLHYLFRLVSEVEEDELGNNQLEDKRFVHGKR